MLIGIVAFVEMKVDCGMYAISAVVGQSLCS